MAAEGVSITCPSCSAPLPIDNRYVTWCDACDWNVEPEREGRPLARREQRREARRLQRAQRVFDEIVREGERTGRSLPRRLLTYVLGLLVLAVGPALLVLAVRLAAGSGGDVPILAGAALLAAVAVLVRPRFGRPPRRDTVVTREQAPALFALLDRCAAALQAQTPTWVLVDGGFNASHGHVGLRRRGLLRIGVGLWAMGDAPQRVAVLGHELAHDVNGDLTHGLVVGGALRTLAELEVLFRPSRVVRTHSAVGFAEGIGELLSAAVARAFRAARTGLRLLAMRASQRAEYRADALSARLAGTEAAAATMDALLLTESCSFAMHRARQRGETPDVWSTVRAHVRDMPPREHERLRRLDRRRGSQVDDSHPPTALRVEMLRRGAAQPAQLGVDDEEMRAVDAELREAHRTTWAAQHRRR